MIDLYRKKPIVIAAVQFDGTEASGSRIVTWIKALGGEGVYSDRVEYEDYQALYIDTLEGVMRADVGDWIIRGVQGEFYPIKPDIFEATYEAVYGD